MDTATEITFGDGVYRAWLPLPQAVELERKCGQADRDGRVTPKSLFTIFEELGAGLGQDTEGKVFYIGGGASFTKDANEVIRLGLIGGNSGPDGEVGPQRARQLCNGEDGGLYGYPARPLSEVCATAWKILHAAIVGIDIKKKADPSPAQEPKRSRRAKS